MKYIKEFLNFTENSENMNESISDLLYLAGGILATLFGISLTASAIILIKSKKMRSIMLKSLKMMPELHKIKTKLKKSKNYLDIKEKVKDFNENPTNAKYNNIMSDMKNLLSSDEINEFREMLSKSHKDIKDNLK